MAPRRTRAAGRVATKVDHVLFAVDDLERAAQEFEERYGLASLAGGRHPGWGTANRIIPLGDAYLELIAVVDRAVARQSGFGRWVADAAPGRALGWAVRTDRIDEQASRLGLEVVAGSRERDDGTRLGWRLAGVEQAAAEPSLPFFIEWGAGTPLPGAVGAATARLRTLELSGDAERLRTWLGPDDLPVVIEPGAAGVTRVELERASGERFLVPEP